MLTGFSICNILNFRVTFNGFLLFSNTKHNIIGNPIFVQKREPTADERNPVVTITESGEALKEKAVSVPEEAAMSSPGGDSRKPQGI